MKKILNSQLNKKIISLVTAIVMIVASIPVADVSQKVGEIVNDIRAAAADNESDKTWTIESGTDLSAFASAYSENPATYQEYTIIFKQSIPMQDGFSKIGTADKPFKGIIRIPNSAALNISLKETLFAYIYDSVTIKGMDSEADTDKSVTLSAMTGMSNKPLFAENVVHDENATPANWLIDIKPYTIDETTTAAHNFGGIIGTINSDAKVNLEITNNSGNISGSGDVGLACNTMGENSTLDVTINSDNSESTNTDYTVTSESGNAGGLVGTMKSGATLNVNSNVQSTGEISGIYAGGMVGYATDATVNFTNSESKTVTATVNGTSGTGGVFGYYKNTKNDVTLSVNSYDINCTLNGKINGGLFGMFENSGSLTITDSYTESQRTSKVNSKRTATDSSEIYGGLIGKYALADKATTNTLTINNITVNIDKETGYANYYGGFIGQISDKSYVKFDNVTVNATHCNENVTLFGGLVGFVEKGFVDANNVIVNTNGKFIGGGIVGSMKCLNNTDAILRLSGTTDLSDAKPEANNGQIVKERGPALIYAENGWKLIRCDTTDAGLADDISAWGEVLRFSDKLSKSDVLTESDDHTVTVKTASTTISSLADFVKLALNIQLNNGSSTGTLCFEDTTNSKNSTLLKSTISLTDDIDLTGTGLTGLARDDGINGDFTGNFYGNGNKITLAIGEPYGYRKNGDNEEQISADDTTINNGSIYTHRYNGLFARTGTGANFENLTISGNINVNNNNSGNLFIHVGGLTSVHSAGSITITSVTVNAKINLGVNSIATYAGGMIGKVAQDANPIISISGCTINPTIDTADSSVSYYIGGAIAMIDSTKTMNISIDDVTVDEDIINRSTSKPKKTGGLIAHIANYKEADTPGIRTITLKKVTVKDTKITANSYYNKDSDYSNCGGLLGQDWNNVDVTIGEENNTNGITVEESTITNNGAGNFAGLVTIATGYWQVNDLNINGLTVTGSSAKSFGMIVNNGYNNDNGKTFALYLELTGENAYKINSANLAALNSSAIYDEILVTSTGAYSSSSDVTVNGRAVVSIHTSDGILKMDGTDCNTYQNQTERAISNRNCRYYYNLDVIRNKDSAMNDSEKLMMWSLNNYAYTNIKEYFPMPSDFSTTKIPQGDYNMKGYSYYPIDVTSGVTVEDGSKFTFYNSEIENSENENGNTDSKARVTTVTTSQHYSMHFGLFRNMSGNIDIKDITFSGNCGYTVSNSGVLTYTAISGTSSNPTTATINGITLNGIKINDVKGALLIDRIGSYSTVKISNVKTEKDSYNDSLTAAQYLIRRVGGTTYNNASNIIVKFSNIVLDSRINDLTDTNANAALTEAYGTTKSIFTSSTLIGTCQFLTTSNCSLVYNYKHSEDWGDDGNTAKHQVTYGREISGSAEYTDEGQQKQYIDKNIYTNPLKSDDTIEEFNFNDTKTFRPYVYSSYSVKNNYHEIKINHKSPASLDRGCGTYNDPYIIYEGMQLKVVADILAGNDPQDGFIVNYTNDNYKSWCDEKNAHKTYTYLTDDDGNFVDVPDVDELRDTLSTAYYKIDENLKDDEGNETDSIELPETFIGLGDQNTPFKGVIDGNGKTIINPTSKSLIYQSTGSVVKDLTVNVTADFTSTFKSVSANTTYETDSGTTPFYGGIFGIVNGGDNIIDNVSVTFNNADSISASGNYLGNVAVGGYVGVVRYGGVIFRNMTSATKPDFSGNTKFGDVDEIATNNVYLYFNPIIGRVIDGYAFTETDHYTPREDESSKPTMQNGTKNYSIADINTSAGKITFNDNAIFVPDGQALFLMGCIAMSGAGSANTSNGKYSSYSYGSNQMVRHADYKNIGTTDSADSDYVLATSDEYLNTEVNVPYIISKYTSETDGNYPARTLTTVTFSIELEENGTYILPDGFRGIGSMNNKDIYMTLSGFDGRGQTIEMNSNFYAYKLNGGYDQYYRANNGETSNLNVGLGLFNKLVMSADNSEIKDLTLKGNATVTVYSSHSSTNKENDGNASMCAGMLAGISLNSKSFTVNSVKLSNVNVNTMSVSGGLIGVLRNDSTKTFTSNKVSADNLTVAGGQTAGGLVGYVYGFTCNVDGTTDENQKSEFLINIISTNSQSGGLSTVAQGSGGIFGALRKSTVDINNISVDKSTAEDSKGSITSRSDVAFAGGVIGCGKNESTDTIKISITNTNVKNIDMEYSGSTESTKVAFFGGIIGGVKKAENTTINLTNINVIGNETNGNTILSGTEAAGLIGLQLGNMTADNCTVENYNMKAKINKGTEGVGGFIGKSESKDSNTLQNAVLKNSKISNCKIQTDYGQQMPAGIIVGMTHNKIQFSGYNILVNNVQLTKLDGTTMTSTTTVGNIAGYVNSNSSVKLVGLCRQNEESDIIVDKDFGTKSGSAYVIYSDYDGKCNGESPNKEASTINATDNVDMNKSPYATINPKQQIDSEKFLTGDGISKNAIAGIRSDTSKYKNVDDDKTNVTDSHISTFKTETNLEIDDAKDFPVLKLTDADGSKAKDVVNSYIHLLTNDTTTSNYAIADSTKYNVSVSQYKYTDGSFIKAEDFETLKSDFTLTSGKYDNQNNQFTLLDVQYYEPGKTNIAYHLYIPVMVVKILDFDFKAAVLSGTNYKAGLYTEKFGNTAMENYGTPVTSYVTYSYKRTAQEWIDAVNSGEVITKGYGKTITLTPEDNVNNLPESTKITIVDRNNNNKAYYSTIGDAFDSSTKKLDFSKFTAADGIAFEPVSFETLLKKSGAVFDEDDKITSFTGIANDSAVDVEENYYISFYTEQTETNMRNIKIGCSSRLGDEGMTPSHRTSVCSADNPTGTSKYARMIFGNLYTQTFSFKTTTTNQAMSEDNNSVGVNLNTTILLAEGTKNSTQTYLGDSTINLFHGFVIDATKTDNQGTEKGIKGQPGVNVSSFTIAETDKKPTVNSNSSVITIYSGDNLIKDTLKSSGSVTIVCKATLDYELSGIVEQFPEKAETENFGTTYEAYSNIAYADYNVESSSMSDNKPDESKNSYYRAAADIALTTLSYNVPSTTADEQTNLGINGREKSEIITADGYYNVSELSSKSQATQVKFTLELYQKNSDGNYEKVNIGDYLKNISIKKANGDVTRVDSSDKKEVTFTADKVTFNGDTEDTYTISTSYEVKTGKEFEDNSYFYANYKVVLTGELLDKDDKLIENSPANDHIIYTNAKIFTEFIQ